MQVSIYIEVEEKTTIKGLIVAFRLEGAATVVNVLIAIVIVGTVDLLVQIEPTEANIAIIRPSTLPVSQLKSSGLIPAIYVYLLLTTYS